MLKKQGFGLLEILMVMVMLTILYTYASNSSSSRYMSSKDIAELNWLTNHLPNSLFLAQQKFRNQETGDIPEGYRSHKITKDKLVAAALSSETGGGRQWEICPLEPSENKLCLLFSGSSLGKLKLLIDESQYPYFDSTEPPVITIDNKLRLMYNFEI